jgi:Lipocalin-like domain
MSHTKFVRSHRGPTALTIALLVIGACGSKTASPATTLAGPTWQIKERVENGGKPSLPECAKDDTLSFTKDGTFTSRIAGTQCNPNEVDAVDQKYMWSSDNKVITFAGDGFSYTGKVLKLTKSQLVIEFDLGPGFVIRDTFTPKP